MAGFPSHQRLGIPLRSPNPALTRGGVFICHQLIIVTGVSPPHSSHSYTPDSRSLEARLHPNPPDLVSPERITYKTRLNTHSVSLLGIHIYIKNVLRIPRSNPIKSVQHDAATPQRSGQAGNQPAFQL
jgi:hypothetical protein